MKKTDYETKTDNKIEMEQKSIDNKNLNEYC